MRKTVLLLMLISVLSFNLSAQVPANITGKAFICGPTYQGVDWSVKWGMATQLSDYMWAVAFYDLGTSVEAGGELVALFTPVLDNWAIGPVAGIGADWNAEPGTGGESFQTYLTGATGLASTYMPHKYFGLWGYMKYQFALKGQSLYEPGWIGGVGVLIQFKL